MIETIAVAILCIISFCVGYLMSKKHNMNVLDAVVHELVGIDPENGHSKFHLINALRIIQKELGFNV